MNEEATSRFFERMDSYDKKLDTVVGEITKIQVNIASLSCKTHEEKFKGYKNALDKHWKLILLVLTGQLGMTGLIGMTLYTLIKGQT